MTQSFKIYEVEMPRLLADPLHSLNFTPDITSFLNHKHSHIYSRNGVLKHSRRLAEGVLAALTGATSDGA
jgi:hypothetical protein